MVKRRRYRNTNGELHRENGPAVIYANYKAWWINGKRHREDGPAIIDGHVQMWYINDKLHRNDGPAYIDKNVKKYYVDGKLHNRYGPAVIDGDLTEWYINGKLHNRGGPAVVMENYEKHKSLNFPCTYKAWYTNGERHREDGPAIIFGDIKKWYVNGTERGDRWVKKYLKIKNKHMIDGVVVSDYWKIREIILRWRYNPNLKCVQNKLKKEFDLLCV